MEQKKENPDPIPMQDSKGTQGTDNYLDMFGATVYLNSTTRRCHFVCPLVINEVRSPPHLDITVDISNVEHSKKSVRVTLEFLEEDWKEL